MTRLANALFVATILAAPSLQADSKVEQFFARNCVGCHGSAQQKGGVRLDVPLRILVADFDLLERHAQLIRDQL